MTGGFLIGARAVRDIEAGYVTQTRLNKILDTRFRNNLFGKGGLLNSNDFIRIGIGFRSRAIGGVDKIFRMGIGCGKGSSQSRKLLEILLKEFPRQ